MSFKLSKMGHFGIRLSKNLLCQFACFVLFTCSFFAAQTADAAEKSLGVIDYKMQLANLSRAELIDELDRLIEEPVPEKKLKVLIDLKIWKLETLAKSHNNEAAAELANYIYKKYDRSSYESEIHYGKSMYQIVESIARTENLSVAYDIIQHLRESVYNQPSVFLDYILDKCLIEVYIETHDYDQALQVAQQVLQNPEYESIDEAAGDKLSLLNEVAYLYNQLGDGENALKYLQQASKVFESENLSSAKLTKARTRNSGNLGRAYLLMRNYTEAEKMGQIVLEGGMEMEEHYFISLGYRLIGASAYHLGDYQKSLDALEAGIEVADAHQIIAMKKSLYNDYTSTLQKMGRYKDAFLWQKKYSSLEMGHQNALLETRLNLHNLEFDAFKTHQENIELRHENDDHRKTSEHDKDVKRLLGFTVISLLLVGGFLTYLLNYLSKSKKKIVRQASEVNAANEKLQMSALLDPLTNLPNRLAVNNFLNEQFERAKQQNLEVAVAHIDFDHFKEINDRYGHPAGDFVLVEIANRMKEWGKSDNFVARIGGDEFLAVLSSNEGAHTIEESLEDLLDSILKPMNFEGITLPASASIGAAIYPTHSKNSSELIVCADLALYEAKHLGRSRIRFFNKQMLETLNSRKALEAELVVALDAGQISPYFQPKSNISTHEIIGVEALIRWPHEKRGFIRPDDFLPVAESAGLMVKLGRHVMEKAIQEAAKWHAADIAFGRLALNASATELHEKDFLEWVLATANRYDLPPSRLSIEILETVMIKDVRFKLEDRLEAIRKAGIHIELDDFGTGYASLQQLNADEIDGLKIDCSFIKNIQDEPSNAAIVSAIVDLANTLNINVVAEGAETFEELEALLKLGCHVVQGYGIARPMPAIIIGDWMQAFQPKLKGLNNADKSEGYEAQQRRFRRIS